MRFKILCFDTETITRDKLSPARDNQLSFLGDQTNPLLVNNCDYSKALTKEVKIEIL